MKATSVSLSAMPGGKAYIGWWGAMGGPKQRGVVQYSLSPFRQRAFAGALHGYLFNGYARLAAQAPYFVLPFGVAYGTYIWAKKKDAWLNSKEGHLATAEHHG